MDIKPSSIIRQDYNRFSKYCHKHDEPVVLTHNGEADLVVMSHEAFMRKEARSELQAKLLVAEKQVAEDMPLMEHSDVIEAMRRKINA